MLKKTRESLVRRFIQRELLQDITPFKLIKLDTDDQKNWVSASHTDIGLGADSVLKVILLRNSLTAFSVCMAKVRSSSLSNPWSNDFILSFTKLSTHLILSFGVSFNASCCYLIMGKLRRK
ncbi:unnamed protein product [Leuciscus chuanchicus]